MPPFAVGIQMQITPEIFNSYFIDDYFDVAVFDPPWTLATQSPTRGVAIGYDVMKDEDPWKLDLSKVVQNGLLFVWTINSKIATVMTWFQKYDFKLQDTIIWIKLSNDDNEMKTPGPIALRQHELCFIASRGSLPGLKRQQISLIVKAPVREQSRKPDILYECIEKMLPGGKFIEVFGRTHNLRNGWTTIGNQIFSKMPESC